MVLSPGHTVVPLTVGNSGELYAQAPARASPLDRKMKPAQGGPCAGLMFRLCTARFSPAALAATTTPGGPSPGRVASVNRCGFRQWP
jgi:hypothetical protein